ncbi:MAG: DUF1624 domain-containing protein [Oscillospiraceae bacterium]|jgi:uncharacterized membrane protein|nr:DUF1624 domain-containing protein [Oscillospiraceae bacterium]
MTAAGGTEGVGHGTDAGAGGAGRIDCIDALRGLAVVLMVAHHLLYDLVEFLDAPEWLFSNPIFDALHYLFAGVFIFLSGVSSRFSRSNIKRGLKTLAAAVAVTLATWYIGLPVLFGILHLLAFCMLFYGLTGKLLRRLPRAAAPAIYIAGLVGSALAVRYAHIGGGYLWALGWPGSGFWSSDYFPVFPWLFVFLMGTWAGAYIRERRLPDWFYEVRIPLLAAVGRRALIIYLLHQPVLYAAVTAIKKLLQQ